MYRKQVLYEKIILIEKLTHLFDTFYLPLKQQETFGKWNFFFAEWPVSVRRILRM